MNLIAPDRIASLTTRPISRWSPVTKLVVAHFGDRSGFPDDEEEEKTKQQKKKHDTGSIHVEKHIFSLVGLLDLGRLLI